jgi:uroporphyrinogen-III synthase
MRSAHPDHQAVLVTRPEPAATETAQRLRALGFAPVLAPCLQICPRPGRLPDPAGVQAVVVASSQALPGLPPTWHGVTMLAVGDATAGRARLAGFRDVRSADGDAAALAALTARHCRPNAAPLLLATGAGLGGELAAALRNQGFRVLRRVVYESRAAARIGEPALRALRGGSVRAALFFSGETARAFVQALPSDLRPALTTVDALAIGQTAAAALESLPWRRVRVAARPTQDELLALLHE